ncbi:MAG: DUF1343 domain-containing protein [Bacteriovoracaceae bacterium]|jgi:uncharacterized protein YbbC (DUF1343 family)|nr:DUF1343 domain-containing protein [Bacteriovoracaceae bacterium]
MHKVKSGLDILSENVSWQKKISGKIGYLCHSASVDSKLYFGVDRLKDLFGERLIKLFGPQHGFVTDLQDNMIETKDFIHPYYKIPVYSLYSATRIPTPEMLKDIDTLIIDLQDVGCRIYTYIHTMTLTLEACQKLGKKVFILDRINPIGGEIIEGNILKPEFRSFVGRYPIPVRHAMTIGEIANYCQKFHGIDCELEIIPLDGWRRNMLEPTKHLSWVNPSPNLPTHSGCLVFPGTVLLEGCNLSEGRGTTRPLEVIGHPNIEPHSFAKKVNTVLEKIDLNGFMLRPTVFHPMFQKHAEKSCGGFHIHVTDPLTFRPWRLGQMLLHLFKEELGSDFKWKNDGYEYQFDKLAIDFINGDDQLRKWVEESGSYQELLKLESQGYLEFESNRREALLY